MKEHTSSPENSENTSASEIIRKKQIDTIKRLQTEIEKKRNTKSPPQVMRPKKFALEEFLSKSPCLRKR